MLSLCKSTLAELILALLSAISTNKSQFLDTFKSMSHWDWVCCFEEQMSMHWWSPQQRRPIFKARLHAKSCKYDHRLHTDHRSSCPKLQTNYTLTRWTNVWVVHYRQMLIIVASCTRFCHSSALIYDNERCSRKMLARLGKPHSYFTVTVQSWGNRGYTVSTSIATRE